MRPVSFGQRDELARWNRALRVPVFHRQQRPESSRAARSRAIRSAGSTGETRALDAESNVGFPGFNRSVARARMFGVEDLLAFPPRASP